MIIMSLNCVCAHAQWDNNTPFESEIFDSQVTLVDDFISIFNGETPHQGIYDSIKNYRTKNIMSLFDISLFPEGQNDKAYTQAYKFATDVVNKNVKIHFSDSTWFAIAPCNGKFKGKDVAFCIFLNVEKRGDNMYKWVINRVQGDIFALTPAKSSKNMVIMPDDHETNFMVLDRITNPIVSNNILNYSRKRFKIDQTSVFYAFINTGLLKIEHVKGLQFVFYQVPGWQFTISNFNRIAKNSGWLISSFSRITEKDKTVFFNNYYN